MTTKIVKGLKKDSDSKTKSEGEIITRRKLN